MRKRSIVTLAVWQVAPFLLKPNVVHIILFNFWKQKFVEHSTVTLVTHRNGGSLLIFEEKWPNDATVPKLRLVLFRNHIHLTTVVSSTCQIGNLLSDVLQNIEKQVTLQCTVRAEFRTNSEGSRQSSLRFIEIKNERIRKIESNVVTKERLKSHDIA